MIVVTPSGYYSYKEIIELINLVIHDSRYKPKFNFVIDIRKVIYTPAVSEIYSISSYIIASKRYFQGKTAIITSGEILYNMFTLSTLFVKKEGLTSSIFKTMEDALLWLGQ